MPVTPIQGPIFIKNNSVPVVPLYAYPNNGTFMQIPVSILMIHFMFHRHSLCDTSSASNSELIESDEHTENYAKRF